jgi:hypothetical protein
MSVSILRYFVCWTLIVLVPPAVLGQSIPSGQPVGAILHTQGGVLVNGADARDSSAIFPGDLVETKAGISANLSLEGTTVLIGPESVTKFQPDYIELDHGTVSVGTSRGYQVHVNCLRVVPAQNEWTNYEVADTDRNVHVAAHKDDVNVSHGDSALKQATTEGEAGERASVHEGQQQNYDETQLCGAPALAHAGGINTKWIATSAGGAGAVIICAVLCRGSGGGSKQPASPSTP